MDPGQSSEVQPLPSEDSGTVEIKIKTLDAQSYSLRVDKNTPVPALKDQIASVVGVPVENQRLICRGKVLKDDQVLSAYNVEDGHTLHLVARQPPAPSALSSGQEQTPGASGAPDTMIVSPRTRPHMSHSVLMGTINIPDTAEGGMPDLNRIISAVLGSVGIGNTVPGGALVGNGGSVAVGVLPTRSQAGTGSDGQPRSGGSDPRPPGVSPQVDQNEAIDDIEAQLQLDAIYGVHSPGIFAGSGATGIPSNPFHLMQAPLVVPDALTTMSQYLDRLEQSLSLVESRRRQLTQGPNATQGATQGTGSTELRQRSEPRTAQAVLGATPGPSGGPANNPPGDSGAPGSGGGPTGPVAPSRRLPTPSALGAIVNRVQNLLNGHAGSALSRLAVQLENETRMVDVAEREEMQRAALRDGNLMQQLGALFLELGRTTMTLRLGQSPAESVVNAGPAVFISSSGPNPMMVQSLPLQGGVAVGTVPSGASQGNVGPSIGPRSINIHIRTSDLRLPSPSPPPPAAPSPQQPPAQTVIGVTSGAPPLNVRDIFDRGDSARPEHGLTVRQIIERAEAATGPQPGRAEPNAASAPGVQGAIMTFNENGAMRVVPVRTRAGTTPIPNNPHSVSEGEALFQPLIARFQHLGGTQHGRTLGTPRNTSSAGASHLVGSGPGELPPQSVPSVRAQVHIQAWAPSVVPATSGALSQLGSSQPVSGGSPANAATPVVPGPGNGGTQNVQRDSTTVATNNRATDGHGSGHSVYNRDSSQPGDGVAQPFDVSQIVDSLGPFLNQIALAFQRPQAPDQHPPPQTNEQPVSRNIDMETENPATATGTQAGDGSYRSTVAGDLTNRTAPVEQPTAGQERKPDQVDATTGSANVSGTQLNAGNSLASHVPCSENVIDGSGQREQTSIDSQDLVAEPPPTPFGLGLGGLQPRPTRTRRRPTPSSRQVQPEDLSVSANAGNGVTYGLEEQNAAAFAGQNLLETLMQRPERASNRSQGDFSDQTLGQFTQGLLPLLSQALSQGRTGRCSGVPRELGEVMGQLMPRTAEEGAGQGAALGDMLRGMMGHIAQSPLMESIAQQVITNTQDETPNGESSPLELNNRSQGDTRSLDIASIVQQMLPVVSQMLGVRPTRSAGQPLSNDAIVRSHDAEGAARNSAGFVNESGRWREALSEEEATSWSETMTADVERQQTMEPQRQFSEVYVRGSPLAKRQKTDVEGAAGQKLENGVSSENVPSVPELGVPPSHAAGEGGLSAYGQGISEAQHTSTGGEGMTNAHMAVLFHDLAARVAADPDFVDDSGLTNATGVFERQKASQEPAGG